MRLVHDMKPAVGAWWQRVHRVLREQPTELRWLVGMIGVFVLAFFLPVGTPRFDQAWLEGLALLRSYAREHVLLCLLPALLIAGAIAVFVSRDAVMNYLGPAAHPVAAYGVASVSGALLAVCSCTVLPLFGGIYRRGAGLGPAVTFLYAGPAINMLALVLTARILGLELGLARALGALCFALMIGVIMHLLYRHEEAERALASRGFARTDDPGRPVGETVIFFAAQIAVLVFVNWAPVSVEDGLLWSTVFAWKWPLAMLAGFGLAALLIGRWHWPWMPLVLTGLLVAALALFLPRTPEWAFAAGLLGLILSASTQSGDGTEWLEQSWFLAKLILPLLLGGVLVAGFLLGRPGHEGLIPGEWITAVLGGNALLANLLAALFGALMYFATLTEVPIVQGLMGAGMGRGPALALLLAGPALSLPSMLVIRQILGTGKTLVYCTLVVIMATCTGFLFGTLYP